MVSTIPIMGHLGAEIGILSFTDMRVPDDQRLGPVGQGLKVALQGVNTGRLGLSATCIGLARWALDQALAYAKVRKTFDKPIGEHQAVQILIADSAADLYAAETMLLDCAMSSNAEIVLWPKPPWSSCIAPRPPTVCSTAAFRCMGAWA